jgi:uncharacterized membrane protein YcaP (DUF421 family)
MNSVLHALIGDLSALTGNAVKTSALFLTAALLFRFTGRHKLSDFTTFDWIATAAAGAIVGRAATATDTSWLSASVALVSLLVTRAALARLRFIPRLRRVIDPPQRILIRNGTVLEHNVRRCGLTPADLQALLRQHGHRNPDRVQLAVFEAMGAFSVLSADDLSSKNRAPSDAEGNEHVDR